MKEFSKSRAAAFFILLSVLVSGCAGSGGAARVAPPGGGSFSVAEPRVYEPEFVLASFDHNFDRGFDYETLRQEEETNPYLLPAVAVPDPDSDAELSDLPPARAFDRSYLVPAVNVCRDFVHGVEDRLVNGSLYLPVPESLPCNRARVPGLTPLYDMVSANVSAKVRAGETVPKLGVVIDGFDEGDPVPDHGDYVLSAANIAAPRELFYFSDVTPDKLDTVDKFEELPDLVNSGVVAANPIVNLSQGNVFSTEAAAANPTFQAYLISPEDVNAAGALVVVSAGNHGPRSRTVGKILTEALPLISLQTTPEQPVHNLDALREIHELTGSILLVAGLNDLTAYPLYNEPLTDENGFHLRYTKELSPEIHGASNRCGDAQDYCVLAPYEIFTTVGLPTQDGLQIAPGFLYSPTAKGTSFSAPLVSGTLMSIRYVWPHLTNRQLVKLSCATAVDLGKRGNDAVYGCGQFSVSDIWQPTGELVDNPEELFSLSIADGAMSVGGASFGEEVKVVGYENNEFRRDYEVSAPASASGTPLRVEPTVSYRSLRTMLRFRGNGSVSVPVGYEGTAAHLFKDAFLFLKGVQGGSAVGLSHASGFSVAFERETDSFFGSYGSGSYKFGDTNKVVASFDREFDLGGTYGLGVKVAAAYGEMEPAISLVKSAKGTAQSAGVSLARRKGNFESRVEMNYNTGLKGTVSIQRREYDLKPLSEAAVMLRMRFVM